MKTIIIILNALFFGMNISSQTSTKTYPSEVKTTANNSYKFVYFSEFTWVYNINNLPLINKDNKTDWSYRYRITQANARFNMIETLAKHIGRYMQNSTLYDNNDMYVDTWHNLNGNLLRVDFTYPPGINIPVEAIESLETSLKKDYKLIATPISYKYTDGIYYISLTRFYSLKQIKEKTPLTRNDNPFFPKPFTGGNTGTEKGTLLPK